MKTTGLFLATILVFCLAAVKVNAQELETWTWDTYKMKFKVPSDFNVTDNNADEFSATNSNIALSIFPRTGEDMQYNEMRSALKDWVVDNGVTNLTEIEYLENLNGYWGCFIEGLNGELPVFAMLIVDPDYKDTCFYVWVNYKEGYEDTVVEMLVSFTPN